MAKYVALFNTNKRFAGSATIEAPSVASAKSRVAKIARESPELIVAVRLSRKNSHPQGWRNVSIWEGVFKNGKLRWEPRQDSM